MNDVELLMSRYPELTYKYETEMPDGQKGLYIDNVVYLNPRQSLKEMVGTLAEELGHYLTSFLFIDTICIHEVLNLTTKEG